MQNNFSSLLNHPQIVSAFGRIPTETDITEVWRHLREKIRGNSLWLEDSRHLPIKRVGSYIRKQKYLEGADGVDKKIVKMLEDGLSQIEIASVLGLSKGRVSRRIKKVTKIISERDKS